MGRLPSTAFPFVTTCVLTIGLGGCRAPLLRNPVPGALAISVRDSATGDPLPEASVQLRRWYRGRLQPGRAVIEEDTTASGRVLWVHGGTFLLEVRQVGFATRQAWVSMCPAMRVELPIALRSACLHCGRDLAPTPPRKLACGAVAWGNRI